jgi:hypothetical protein
MTLPFWQQQWELDDLVMTSYGAKLFPRAIGYSAGLIDYFFSGEVTAITGNGSSPNATATSYPIEFLGSNFVSDFPQKLPAGTGTISLVAFVMSWPPWTIISRHASQPKTVTIVPTVDDPNGGIPRVDLTLDFSSNPFPGNDHSQLLKRGYFVWRGPAAELRNGQVTIVEQDAVMIGDASFYYD